MLKSMTAFGRANLLTAVGRFIVEIQSLNRKHLEISLYLPPELIRFDPEIRRWVAAETVRGQVIVRIKSFYEEKAPFQVKANLVLANEYKNACMALAKTLDLPPDLTLESVIAQPGVLVVEEELTDEKLFLSALHQAVHNALVPLKKMKMTEGAHLEKDIRERLHLLSLWIDELEKKAPDALERQKQKLHKKLEELLLNKLDNTELIIREMALYASRIDISEEIVRFRSHLIQFHHFLDQHDSEKGKSLDFLIQELNREANTMASKSQDAVIAQKVVDIKGVLEKIREQVQNIE